MHTIFRSDAHDAWKNYLRAAAVMGSVALILLFTILSGLGDAEGFVHASRVWQDGRFVWSEALKCFLGFQFGMLMYWLALWKLSQQRNRGRGNPDFVLVHRHHHRYSDSQRPDLRWPGIDQVVAGCVLAGIGWLMCRGAR